MLFSEGKQRRNGSEGGEGMGGTGRGEERGKCGLDLLNEYLLSTKEDNISKNLEYYVIAIPLLCSCPEESKRA